MSGIKGDFTGFSFGNKHSSDLGITRTSNGSRYDENLFPTLQDKTVQVPGGDGTYYFGSYYTQKPFNIPFAFDSLTEEELSLLRAHFGSNRNPQRLIFDEAPYKYYMAKITGTPQIKTICFDEKYQDNGITKTRRIYKGEGTLNFVCYYPFAKSVYKFLDEYTNANKEEWRAASGMKDTQGNYDQIGSTINLYNPGVQEADFKLYLTNLSRLELNGSILSFKTFSLNSGDSYICVNSKNNLIEGCDNNYNPTGNIYNKYIDDGDFFKIPLGESSLVIEGNAVDIKYEYIYY